MMRRTRSGLPLRVDPATGRAQVERGPLRVRPAAPYRSKLEAAYATYLDALRHEGDYVAVEYERLTVRLAPQTTYTPDFLCVRRDGTIELHEVKGRPREDAWVKLKLAAALCPWWRWCLVRRVRGNWVTKEVGP